ncbi:hypothetical protein MIMGU_mgv1a021659mg [Erythranthe guttata]|uniref:Uncharacterized protein n=1 Tax=Erythranthe guttata TaxID=4155 RepID=A0A022R3Y2_ERYGU|nr:hypothetical protein MIMGU_mgv1a021659mg [Erythranthe guttata]
MAADLTFRGVLDGSLSMGEMDIERRPYHRDCKCALHEIKGRCLHSTGNIPFPKREFRSKCSLSLSSSNISSQSSYLHILKTQQRTRTLIPTRTNIFPNVP